jgi:hypothetical protein
MRTTNITVKLPNEGETPEEVKEIMKKYRQTVYPVDYLG